MPRYETFAKRKRKAEQSGKPVVFRHDDLPYPLRVQIVQILNSAIGDPSGAFYPGMEEGRLEFWGAVHAMLTREMGVFSLWPKARTDRESCLQFLLNGHDVDDVLSLIELTFFLVQWGGFSGLGNQEPKDAITELNDRFREHAVGYQFESNRIISVESLYLHTETVQPAIQLLHDAQFVGPLQEFMQAHEHYRKGDNTEAIANAQYAFESTMKAICDRRGWSYGNTKATARNLLGVLFDNDLIPSNMQSHFTALRSTLESGLPTVRNQPGQGGHGQGSAVVEVPDYLAAYCLHLVATNIVFLIEAHNASK